MGGGGGGGGVGFQTFVCLFLVLFSNIISLSNAYGFKVGGKDGWTLNPSENYNTWSKRQRFLINDTLTFKYPKGSDSVLAVTKDDYDNCNINNPITKLDDGDSVFKLDRSGPFYFISGNKSNCDQGQKIALVVISLRVRGPPKPPLAPPPPPVPTSPPPAIAPVSSPPSPATAITPVSSPLSPATAITPVSSPPSPPPAITPVSSPPSPPPAITPVSSPPSPPPSTTPVSSPPSPATTPASSPTSPEIPATPSPGSETPVKSAPGPSGPPVAPPPMSFAAAAFTPSVVLVASVSLVMALGSFATSY